MIEMMEEKGEKILAILPVYMYDHSGITISTEPFGCRFDSGQVGWAVMTKSSAEAMGFSDSLTVSEYENIIKEEIKTYDSYLCGEVYEYEVIGNDGDVLEYSGGYWDLKDCIQQAKSVAESSIDPWVAEQVEAIQNRATYAGYSNV